MTVNHRLLAREWLYLLGGLAMAFSAFILFGPIFTPPAGRLIVIVVSYLLVRITVWAIRTLRETVE